MNTEEKYSKLLKLSSIGKLTAGTYPSLREFKDALDNNRVFGDYEKRVVIVSSDNQHIQYYSCWNRLMSYSRSRSNGGGLEGIRKRI